MTEHGVDTAALAHWLENATGESEFSVTIDGKPSGGFSAETLLLTARRPGVPDQRFVARLETPEPAVYPPQSDLRLAEIEIQFRIMRSLKRHSELPLADLVGYESDSNVLGTQFFVMRFVEGVVPIESPPYSVEGFFTELPAPERTALISNGLKQLAQLHKVDVGKADLQWLTPAGNSPGSQHLLHLWRTFGERELRGRSHPLLEAAWSILDTELPPDGDVGFCWGDPRPGNIIWRGTTPVCLTDFEASCLGPPEFDLGWWLMFDRTMHELACIDRLPGDPTRDQQREMYYTHADRPVVDTAVHELFAAARYCVIVVRVMNRLEHRGLLPADSTVWRDNPATACLQMILDEQR